MPTALMLRDAPPGLLTAGGLKRSPVPILHASTLIAPVPCRSTLAAIVPLGAFRARMIGLLRRLQAVPHPPKPEHLLVVGSPWRSPGPFATTPLDVVLGQV